MKRFFNKVCKVASNASSVNSNPTTNVSVIFPSQKKLRTKNDHVLKCLPLNIYFFKVNNSNSERCEICSKLTIRTSKGRH